MRALPYCRPSRYRCLLPTMLIALLALATDSRAQDRPSHDVDEERAEALRSILDDIPPTRLGYESAVRESEALRDLVFFRAEIAARHGDIGILDSTLRAIESLGGSADSRLGKRVFEFPTGVDDTVERRIFLLDSVLPFLFPAWEAATYNCGPTALFTQTIYIQGVLYTGEQQSSYVCRSGALSVAHAVRKIVFADSSGTSAGVVTSLEFDSPWMNVYYPDRETFTVTPSDISAHTLLAAAAVTGQIDVMAVLVDRGASIDLPSDSGYTALHLAALSGQNASTSWLLEAGADPNAATDAGRTPLHSAVGRGDAELIRTLVSFGASVDRVADDGDTALLAAIRSGRADLVRVLLDLGADPEIKDANGNTALMLAVSRMPQLIPAMVEAGANPNTKGPSDWTALHFAAESGVADVIDDLLRLGADLSLRSERGRTALSVAAAHANTDAVRLLIENGAEVDAADDESNTPLMLASGAGSARTVEVLLRSGASRKARNEDGKRAVDVAKSRKRIPVLQLYKHIEPVHVAFAKASVNLARLEHPQHESSPGVDLGMSLAVRVQRRIRLQTDVGLAFRATDPVEEGEIQLPPNGDWYYWLTSVDVRPQIRYAIGNPYRHHLYVLGGVGYSAVLDNVLRDWTKDNEDVDVLDTTDDSFVSINAGLGVEFARSRSVWTLELTYMRVPSFQLDRFDGALGSWGFSIGFGK
ncbi:MAG: ankyrin repeat domain-containing protein [Rhodothermales bacterium]